MDETSTVCSSGADRGAKESERDRAFTEYWCQRCALSRALCRKETGKGRGVRRGTHQSDGADQKLQTADLTPFPTTRTADMPAAPTPDPLTPAMRPGIACRRPSSERGDCRADIASHT